MNKLLRQFLSGGSLAALQLCALGGGIARAAGTTISNTRTNVVINTAKDFILVSPTGNITGSLTNNATVGVHSFGIEVQTGASIAGKVINGAAGVINASRTGIAIQSGADLVGGINNAGKIQVQATHTSGTARGVDYRQTGGQAMNLTNSGTVLVSATGTHVSSSISNHARGLVEIDTNAHLASPTLNLTNSGAVTLKGTASVSASNASTRARADARFALDQGVDNNHSATLNLSNSAALRLQANAKAFNSSERAYAFASAKQAIRQTQEVSTLVAGTVVTQTVTNSGQLSLAAVATATGGASRGHASAHAGSAIQQFAERAADVEQSLTNSGQLNLLAAANAKSTGSNASANAYVVDVLVQGAENFSTSASLAGKANLTLTNSGVMSLGAFAKGTGTQANGQAHLSYVMDQGADIEGVINEKLTNTNTGNMTLVAQGTALARSGNASAGGFIRNGFYQFASDSSVLAAESSISQTLSNSASLTLTAAAKATLQSGSSNRAIASAKISQLFHQAAEDVITTVQSLTNSGAIIANANGAALASNLNSAGHRYDATGHAGISRLFYQNATGTNVTSRKAGSKITQTISNTGALTLGAVANAQGKAASASGSQMALANAFIDHVFYQEADDATAITQSLSNSASLHLNATALAKYTGTATQKAFARATVHNVFEQDASANYFPSATIAQIISNTGSISIGVHATGLAAAANADADVDATARASDIFYQSAQAALTITQAITNSGALNVTVAAKATNLARYEYAFQDHASARIEDVFYQSAETGGGAAHSSDTQSVTNSGALTLTATASGTRGVAAQTGAAGTMSVSARVFDIFSQSAQDAVTIAQTVTNTGAIIIKSTAAGSALGSAHKAYVNANASEIVQQYASGDGLTGSAATQTVSNTASIGITLSAKAKGQNAFTGSRAASAGARASDLFEQRVQEALNATQVLTNSGAITVKANATATGVGHTAYVEAQARAERLFLQTFTADNGSVAGGTVSQAITNSGAIGLTLAASANGQVNRTSQYGAEARAFASHLFSQKADLSNSSSGTLSQTISNTGTITIAETTTATTTKDRDDAESDSFDLFRQDASDSGNVTQSLTSGGAISATLAATAKGATRIAEATASMGSVIRQYISDSNKATQNVTISNTGSITVNETANAVAAAAGKRAFAEAHDDDPTFAKFAFGNDGAVSQSFTNNAAIKLTYAAVATGVTEATGEGRLGDDFVEQDANSGSSLAQTITNNGAITIALSGRAKAKAHASAIATMGSKLWAQTGSDSGKPANQTITNTATVSVSLIAAAVATTKNALANANYNGWVVNQSASAGNLGVLTQSITNSGALSLAATAVATGKTHASAKADHNIVLRQEGRKYTDVTQTITNSGAISLNAIAKALAPSGAVQNQARAHFNWVMFQSAESNLITTAPGIFVNQTITNSGAISIKNAASATGAAGFTVTAEGDGLFQQENNDSGSLVTQKLNNSGSLTVSLSAKGKSSGNGTAFAEVRGGDVFAQSVSQSHKAGQVGNLSITNSGALSIGGGATVTGLNRAHAEANLSDVFDQSDENSVSGALAITNSGTISVSEVAKANAKGQATVSARADFASQDVFVRSAANFTNATVSLTNSGKVTLAAAGTAVATNSAKVTRVRAFGAWQDIDLEDTSTAAPTGSLSINNSGTLALTATAKGTAGNRARVGASATGAAQEFRQEGGDAGTSNLSGTISFANSGTISVAANATVLSATPHVALAGTTPSFVHAYAIGLNVFAEGFNETAQFTGIPDMIHRTVTPTLALSNSGTMSVAAVAVGAGVDHAKATATAAGMLVQATSQIARQGTSSHSTGTFEHGTKQFAGTPVRGAISNSGTMTVSATATGGRATAGGINVEGSVHGESITNAVGGSLSVTAAGATVLAGGINLSNFLHRTSVTFRNNHNTANFTSRTTRTGKSLLEPATNVTGAITNSGSLTVSATGTVSEEADGVLVNAAKVGSTIINAGVMNITAAGPAAVANGFHLVQSNYGTTNTSFFRNPVVGADSSGGGTRHVRTRIGAVAFAGVLNNTGTITVTANASTGNGSANGIDVEGGSLQGGSVLNSGTINAIATGPTAIANGVLLSGGGAVGVSNRSGTINATATSSTGAVLANGVFLFDGTLTGTVMTSGSGTITASGVSATANGWLIQGAGKLVMTGSGGVLNVNATGSKSNAVANGINVQGGSLTGTTITNSDTINTHATAPSGTTTVANSILVVGSGAVTVANAGGTLSSLVTIGGATSYGSAINVNGASAAAITLSGGTIAGNIVEASGGNAITVSGGNTLFNGGINPSKALLGSVTVATGGTLTLGLNGGLGAGNVWTGSFVQQGTLALNATTDTTVEGTVHAATATLSGPAVLNINLAGPAIPLSSTYKVVFTTGALTGTWSSVTVADPTFLTAAGVYTANEADITLTRKSLGAISGLTPNEQAVGNALETIYEAGGSTGPLGSLTSALFALTPTQYADALQQLSGETIGDLVATDAADLQNMVDTVISHLDEGAGGGASGTALNSMGLPGVHPAQDEDFGPVSVWGGFIASGSQVSGTISSPSYHTHMNGLMAGADFGVSTNTLLGIAVGYNNGGLRTANDRGSFNVIEVSGYGRYEDPNNPWYALADISYGGVSNKLDRTIAIPGLATTTVSGKFDTSTLALYGEAGYHLDSSIKLTPYAAISYLNADADPFTETGSFVAPLNVAKSSSNATISYLGAWFSQTWMSDNLAITPSIKAAWEHDFNSNAWTVNASFAPVSTAGFAIDGSAMSQDAAFIDAGISLNGGDNVTFGLDYQGRLSSDRTQSAIVGRVVFKF